MVYLLTVLFSLLCIVNAAEPVRLFDPQPSAPSAAYMQLGPCDMRLPERVVITKKGDNHLYR